MSGATPRLVLASRSPRRAEILRTLGIDFDVRPTGVDEDAIVERDHETFVRAVAERKLGRALELLDTTGAFVLAADTIVCVGESRLGQPANDDDAGAMLGVLQGRDHLVRTAFVLGREGSGILDGQVVSTRVWFRDVSPDEIRRYVVTGEGRDKAGGYAVQGIASGFVTRIDGSYSNVVGLPAAEVVWLLREHGALSQWP